MLNRILIVDTEASLVHLIRHDVEVAGYQVDAVTRDAEADVHPRENAPDLIDELPRGASGDDRAASSLCTVPLSRT
jgi:DNA-binding NtrC family response regulator